MLPIPAVIVPIKPVKPIPDDVKTRATVPTKKKRIFFLRLQVRLFLKSAYNYIWWSKSKRLFQLCKKI